MNTKDEIKHVEAEVMEKTSATAIVMEPQQQLPIMEVNIGGAAIQKHDEKELISDNEMIGLYQEILGFIRDDRKEIDEALSNFVEMVINGGDASTSSKEALVNLMKIKSETTNNMSRVMDLLMRAKLKERDTFPKYLAAHQHNEIKIGGGNKRKLIEKLAKQAEKKKGE